MESATKDKAPAVELGDAGIVADFHAPENSKYMDCNVVQDKSTGVRAVLYAVTTYEGNDIWSTYSHDYATLHVQLFDEKGAFIKRISTEHWPFWGKGIAEPSGSCHYDDGLLTFFSSGGGILLFYKHQYHSCFKSTGG